jgi:D-threo-aldose 1-dehydrogenase
MSTTFDPAARRPLGRTRLSVSGLCVGSGGLGSVPELFGEGVSEDRAVATVLAAFASPLNFYDTSAGYSDGEAERRIGLGIRRLGGVPAGWVVETKADPDPVTGAFDGAAVRRSAEASLERLGLDRVPLFHLHDPERLSFAEATAPGGAVEAMVRLKEEGLADHIGVAGGPVGNLLQYLELGVFEVVLTHNRFTLLDRTAEPLLDRAAELGVGVLQGAPFGGGVLAKGLGVFGTYCYAPLSPATRRHAEDLSRICAEAGVPLGAAALQFPLRDPRVTSVVVGVTRPERIAQAIEWARYPIDDATWSALLAAAGRDAGLDNTTR